MSQNNAANFNKLYDSDASKVNGDIIKSSPRQAVSSSFFKYDTVYQDNAHQLLRDKLVKRYNKYYAHWKDFNVLVAALASIGLIMEWILWDTLFA